MLPTTKKNDNAVNGYEIFGEQTRNFQFIIFADSDDSLDFYIFGRHKLMGSLC